MRWEFTRLASNLKKNIKKLIVNSYSDIKSAAHELFVILPKDVMRFIKRLRLYIPLIWNDRDWDHHYILVMLKFKIQQTRKYIQKEQRHVGWKKDVNNMLKAEKMLESIMSGELGDGLYEQHDKKWGKPHFAFIPVDEPNRGSVMKSNRLNVNTPADAEQERKEYMQLIKKVNRLQANEWNRLWKHLSKHMQSWWD